MGIHSGDIRAGVIGQKLPRFRLFGDTINTSARMMQKAEPGQLMCGEATHALLPVELRSACRAFRNKEGGDTVFMKGKGEVKVFLFEGPKFTASDSAVQEVQAPMKPKDMEIREEVDKVMRDVAGGKNSKGLPFILSEKAEFTTEDELHRKKNLFSEVPFTYIYIHCMICMILRLYYIR